MLVKSSCKVEAHVERVGHRVGFDRGRDLLLGLVLVDHHDFGVDVVVFAPLVDGVDEQLVGLVREDQTAPIGELGFVLQHRGRCLG